MSTYKNSLPIRKNFELEILFSLWIFVWFLFMHITKFSIVGFGSEAIKPAHVLSVVFCIVFIKKTYNSLQWKIIFGCLYMILTSIFSWIFLDNPVSSGLVSYLYCLFVFMVAIKSYEVIGERIIFVLRISAIFLLILLYIKLFIYYDYILKYLANPISDHPKLLPVFTSLNLEATWITLSLSLFISRRIFYPLWLLVVLLDIIYSSRVSLVLALLIFSINIITYGHLSKRLAQIIILLPAVSIIIVISSPEIFTSFLTATEKGGLVSRFVMWSAVPDALAELDVITGYGAQNAIVSLERVSGTEFSEGNVHNLILQILLDGGVLALVMYMALFVFVVWNQCKENFKNEYGNYLLAYLVGSLIQFQGTEAQLWMILGLFSASLSHRSQKECYGENPLLLKPEVE